MTTTRGPKGGPSMRTLLKLGWLFWTFLLLPILVAGLPLSDEADIGREVSVGRHLQDGEEFQISLQGLIRFGKKLFTANWTIQEGGGRPLTKGTGSPLSDPSDPLIFPRNFNRLSSPDANSCAGCHNLPIVGGGGDIVTKVFVLGQRFDFLTFNHLDTVPTKGEMDELGNP